MSAAAVILAAGGGSRYNAGDPSARPGAKLLAPLRGRTVVEWAVAPALECGFNEVIVVVGAADLRDVLPTAVTIVSNDDWALGQASSLRAGLAWCEQRGHDCAVVGLGDTPGLSAQSWRTVVAAPGGPMVFATYNGRRGHPVRLDAVVWPLLATSGDEGARSLARERPELVSEVPCDGESFDIDVPSDLEQWK